jgi:hypothetical protein
MKFWGFLEGARAGGEDGGWFGEVFFCGAVDRITMSNYSQYSFLPTSL